MDGKEFQLTLNDGSNHLHGGFFGFGKIQSKASIISGGKVAFSYVAKDGEEGYPSSVLATVTYTITEDNELVIDYAAMGDGPTPIYMTNHSYFNLTGHVNIYFNGFSDSVNMCIYYSSKLLPKNYWDIAFNLMPTTTHQ